MEYWEYDELNPVRLAGMSLGDAVRLQVFGRRSGKSSAIGVFDKQRSSMSDIDPAGSLNIPWLKVFPVNPDFSIVGKKPMPRKRFRTIKTARREASPAAKEMAKKSAQAVNASQEWTELERKAVDIASRQFSRLVNWLQQGRFLEATGRMISTSESVVIKPIEWQANNLGIDHGSNQIYVNNGKEWVPRFEAVVLKSPAPTSLSPADLHGMPFAAAYYQFVIAEILVEAFGSLASAEMKSEQDICDGKFWKLPGGTSDQYWPIAPDQIRAVGLEARRTNIRIVKFQEVLAQHLERLIAPILTGDVLVGVENHSAGTLKYLPAKTWKNRRLWLSLVSSHIGFDDDPVFPKSVKISWYNAILLDANSVADDPPLFLTPGTATHKLSRVKRSDVESYLVDAFSGERRSKAEVRKEAMAKFPGLSARAFDDKWKNRAPASWKNPGRFKKLR